jgi:hypothetical protein
MLRAALIASPFVLFGVISCGDSSSNDVTTNGGSTSAAGAANAGENSGGASETAGTTSTGNTSSGGTTSAGGADNTPGGASSGGTTSNAGGAPESMAGAEAMAGAGGAAAGANCPNIFGTYTMTGRVGMCGTLTKAAPQSIKGNDVACVADFVSVPAKLNQPAGINGGTAIDAKGDFTKAKLTLDKTVDSPCEGTWDAQNKTMTVKCGPVGSVCTITLAKQ